jgi:hypothetical protein
MGSLREIYTAIKAKNIGGETQVHTQSHVCMHALVHTHTHTHTHTHVHVPETLKG